MNAVARSITAQIAVEAWANCLGYIPNRPLTNLGNIMMTKDNGDFKPDEELNSTH